MIGRKQERDFLVEPKIAWQRADIAFRRQPRRRSAEGLEGKFRDDSQSPQAIIELDSIGEFEKVAAGRSVSFYFSFAVEGIRLCILPADHRYDHSECCPP